VQKARFYQPELDILRWVAFLAVFVHHAFPWTPEKYGAAGFLAPVLAAAARAGGYGVDLFFCLSAYLITTLLVREVSSTAA
jgi:peptidoglycan/LPS O-acetylase OafA/YrhL